MLQSKNAGRSSRTLPMLLAAAAVILLINLLADSRSAFAPQAEPARPRVAQMLADARRRAPGGAPVDPSPSATAIATTASAATSTVTPPVTATNASTSRSGNLPAALANLPVGSDIFISFASGSMAPFALNWVANLRKAGVVGVLVGALDEKMLNVCEENGISSMLLDGSSIKKRKTANLRFDYAAYKRMAALKVSFYINILMLGYNVWACDADTAWMQHPGVFVNEYPMQHADILTTTDCIDVEGDVRNGCWHVDHNTGLVYMRSRPAVIEFANAWKEKVQSTRDIMIRDQAALNLLMREKFHTRQWVPPADPQGRAPVRPIYYAWNDKIKLARLPLRYFANGHTAFVQRIYAKPDHPPPFALHMTYQYGDSSAFAYGKRQRMREARVWWVDPPSYFHEGRYLAVAPEAAALPIDWMPSDCTTEQAANRFNREDAHLRETLRDALGLAIALNRTLVMPRMLCYCDNIWKEMKHCRVGGAFDMTLPFDCPADHIIPLAKWFESDFPEGFSFREPGFLSDPRLSDDIRSSWVRVDMQPASAEQARAALAPYESARVLEFAGTKRRFCGFESGPWRTRFRELAAAVVPYSRHFCMEDGLKVGNGGIPFYSPCCHGLPGRFFPCVHSKPPPTFDFTNPPDYCAARLSTSPAAEERPVPADYPDLSPNPRSRHFHKFVDNFAAAVK